MIKLYTKFQRNRTIRGDWRFSTFSPFYETRRSLMTPLHIARLCWSLTQWCMIGTRRPWNCKNPLPVKCKMADGTKLDVF